MAGSWPPIRLRDAGIALLDCDHRTPKATSTGYPYVTIPQMQDGEINLRDARLISSEDYTEWTKKTCPEPFDVLLSRRCNPGETAYVRSGQTFAVGQNLVLLRSNGSRVAPRFLRWMTRGQYWWNEVEKYRNQGAVFDSLKCQDIINFELPIPPLEDQEVIAYLLDTLDDKIHLNRRLSATLEATAQALFKSWFVDFDPVCSRVNRLQLRLPNNIGDMFPDSLGADGLPEGWGKTSLLDHARLISGGTPTTTQAAYWDGHILWASAKDVSQSTDRFLISTERRITKRGLEESATRLVPKFSTVIVARGATTGRHCLFGAEMAMNQTCYALSSLNDAPFWLTCTFTHIADELLQRAHGSVFDTITTTTLKTAAITTPNVKVIRAFEQIAQPIYRKVLSTIEENATLSQMRDALLPKLISGQLRIRDAERIVGTAA